MKYHVEDSLSNFKFWSGAESRAALLSSEQFDVVEQMFKEIEPEDGWSDTDINDMFWYDFNTICDWLGYKDEEHLERGLTNDEVQEVEDWAEEMSENYDELFDIAGLKREEYIFEDEDGDDDMDCYSATKDFMSWWDKMDDFAKHEEYSKHQ